ncbi:MAG: thiamine phosphate synthase [Bryobacteraceae bacterium]
MIRLPRLYPILDSGVAQSRGCDVLRAAKELIEAGVQILQFRHKGFFSREVFTQTEQLAVLCRNARIPFVINDRADLAVLMGAWLHLGQDDLSPTAARRITGPDAIIGFSTHNEAQLRAAAEEPVDYLALGPVFGTASKQNPDPMVGLEELRRLRPLTNRQLVAIGGITRENAHAVLDAGADSIALIGDLFPQDGSVRGRAKEWMEILR